MNIQRYKWPVVVAASLHGALFLVTPSESIVIRHPTEKPPRSEPPPHEMIEIRDPPENDATAASGGAVDPLPREVDIPAPDTVKEPFRVPVSEPSKPTREVVKLPGPGRIGEGIIGEGIGPGTGPVGIVTTFDLDRAPRAMAQPPPDYPYSMRVAGITGSVTVEFVVGTDGHVLSAEVVRSTHREFADPALKAVLRWKFEPGTINGRKVRFRMAVPIEFNAR